MPSLVEALELKYGDVFSHIDSSTDSDKFLILEDEQKSIINGYCTDNETIQVEIFVPKISPREKIPSLLILNDCDIATAGEKQDLNDKCRVVEELDLAKNKLNRWCEVFTILKQMPRLRFLNLSFNKLSTPLDYPLNGSSFQSQHLQILILNSTMIDWKSIRKLLKWFPSLVELHLSKNDYESVKVNDDTTACCACSNQQQCANCQKHLSLQVLYFNGNLIREWTEIVKFGIKFPNLQTLVLANCPIESLSGTAGSISNDKLQSTKSNSSDDKVFANLKVLNLNSTLLSSWNDIEALGRFPALQNVRVQNWPLWELQDHTEHERRQLLIARLPNVTTLNGSGPISDQEREDSERAFIRYYMEKEESDRPARYFELVNVHGKLDPLVSVDLRPEKRVRVTFTCNSNREVRLVDVYRTVSDLKTKLETFSGIPASQMRLFYVDQDLIDIQGPEEMKYPNKQLYSYNICSGDEIIIDLKLKK